MALFGKKQEEAKPAEAAQQKAAPKAVKTAAASSPRDLSHALVKPRITEKASMLQTGGAYVFDISEKATKPDVVRAIRELYKVTPTKIRVVTIPKKVKLSMRTGRTGVRSGGRKAYVFLKKGDSITIA